MVSALSVKVESHVTWKHEIYIYSESFCKSVFYCNCSEIHPLVARREKSKQKPGVTPFLFALGLVLVLFCFSFSWAHWFALLTLLLSFLCAQWIFLTDMHHMCFPTVFCCFIFLFMQYLKLFQFSCKYFLAKLYSFYFNPFFSVFELYLNSWL